MGRPRKDPAEKAVQQSINVKPDIYTLLRDYCTSEDRTISWVVDQALRQFFNVED